MLAARAREEEAGFNESGLLAPTGRPSSVGAGGSRREGESLYDVRMSNFIQQMTHEKKGPVTVLREQLADKDDSCKKLQEDYLRAVADFDNLRKRVARDSELSRRLALEALVVELLPVLDNFQRAVEAAGTAPTTESLQKGMDLIYRQLRDALGKHGLQEYSCLGTEFDPRKAEAVGFVHTDEHKPGTVVNEMCKGYLSGERVLRPAKVVVAKEPDRAAGQEQSAPAQESGPGSEDQGSTDREGQGVEIEVEDSGEDT
jgi:molecular chaperone GrpE